MKNFVIFWLPSCCSLDFAGLLVPLLVALIFLGDVFAGAAFVGDAFVCDAFVGENFVGGAFVGAFVGDAPIAAALLGRSSRAPSVGPLLTPEAVFSTTSESSFFTSSSAWPSADPSVSSVAAGLAGASFFLAAALAKKLAMLDLFSRLAMGTMNEGELFPHLADVLADGVSLQLAGEGLQESLELSRPLVSLGVEPGPDAVGPGLQDHGHPVVEELELLVGVGRYDGVRVELVIRIYSDHGVSRNS